MKWKDTTSYSRGDKERTPRGWTLGESHRESIIVHRHPQMPGVWFLSCYMFGIEQLNLQSREIEDAKAEAIKIVAARVRNLVTHYKELGLPL